MTSVPYCGYNQLWGVVKSIRCKTAILKYLKLFLIEFENGCVLYFLAPMFRGGIMGKGGGDGAKNQKT